MTIPGSRNELSRRLALTLGLIATFALVVIVAGHGVAPIGYLLIWGWSGWTAPDLIAWFAIMLLAGGCLIAPGRSVGRSLLWLGALASVASWILFIRRSELLPLTLASSLPYLACLVAWARQIGQRDPGAARSPASEPRR